MEAGERYWAALEPAWGLVDIYNGSREFKATFAQLTPIQKTLFAVHFCQSEVRNGGFYQFFSNPTGVLAPEAVQGFETIGMPEAAQVLRQAMAFFDFPYPRGQGKRQARLDRRQGKTREEWDPFHKLDAPFYAALDSNSQRFERAADEYALKADAPSHGRPTTG